MSYGEIKRRINLLLGKLKSHDIGEEIEATPEEKDADHHADNVKIIRALDGLVNQKIRENHNQETSENGKKFREYLTIFLLFLTVLFTVITYFVFRDQLDVSRDTEKRQLRAYVFTKPNKTIEFNGQLPFEFCIPLENTGLTPAHDTETSMWAHMAANPLPESENLREGKEVITQQGIIEPGGGTDHGIRINLKGDSFGLLPIINKHPEIAIYVSGVITYKDVFNDRHTYDFCNGYAANPEGGLRIVGCRNTDHKGD